MDRVYEWQPDKIKILKKEPLFILNAATASGKSTVCREIAKYRLKTRGKMRMAKVIILVPQQHLCKSFIEGGFFEKSGIDVQNIAWTDEDKKKCKGRDFAFQKKREQLKQFLLGGERGVCVTTHKCIADIEDWIRKCAKRCRLFEDTAIYVDEAHKVSGLVRDESISETEKIRNKLGKVLQKVLSVYEDQNTSIGLISATFIRATSLIMKFDLKADFKCVEHPLEDHIDALQLEDLRFELHAYKQNKRSKKDSGLKFACEWIWQQKSATTEHIRTLIRVPRIDLRGYRKSKKVIKEVRYHLRGLKVLDALTEEGKEHAKELIIKSGNDHQSLKELDSYDSVVACNLFDEGVDWPALNRVANLQLDNSPVKIIQVPGRVLRKHPYKRTVRIATFVQETQTNDALESYKERMRIQITLLTLAAEYFGSRFTLPAIVNGRHMNVSLDEVFGDNNQHVIRECIEIYEDPDVSGDAQKFFEEIEPLLSKADKSIEIEDLQVLKEKMYRRAKRQIYMFKKAQDRNSSSCKTQAEETESLPRGLGLFFTQEDIKEAAYAAEDLIDHELTQAGRVMTKMLTAENLRQLRSNNDAKKSFVKLCECLSDHRKLSEKHSFYTRFRSWREAYRKVGHCVWTDWHTSTAKSYNVLERFTNNSARDRFVDLCQYLIKRGIPKSKHLMYGRLGQWRNAYRGKHTSNWTDWHNKTAKRHNVLYFFTEPFKKNTEKCKKKGCNNQFEVTKYRHKRGRLADTHCKFCRKKYGYGEYRKSKYGIGVYKEYGNKFRGRIRRKRKNYTTTTFDTPEEAQRALEKLKRQRT